MNIFVTDINWRAVYFYYKDGQLFYNFVGSGTEILVIDDSPKEILDKAKKAKQVLKV